MIIMIIKYCSSNDKKVEWKRSWWSFFVWQQLKWRWWAISNCLRVAIWCTCLVQEHTGTQLKTDPNSFHPNRQRPTSSLKRKRMGVDKTKRIKRWKGKILDLEEEGKTQKVKNVSSERKVDYWSLLNLDPHWELPIRQIPQFFISLPCLFKTVISICLASAKGHEKNLLKALRKGHYATAREQSNHNQNLMITKVSKMLDFL